MSVGWWGKDAGRDVVVFPGFLLYFQFVDNNYYLRVRMLDFEWLWGRGEFRRSGWSSFNTRIKVEYKVTLRVEGKGELDELVLSQVRDGVVGEILRYFKLTEDWKGLVDDVIGDKFNYTIPFYTPVSLYESQRRPDEVTFSLEFYFPVDIKIKVFGDVEGGEETFRLVSFYEVWSRKVIEYRELLEELVDRVVDYCNEFVRTVNLEGIFRSFLGDVKVDVGPPQEEVKYLYVPFLYVYAVEEGRRSWLTSPIVEFQVKIPTQYYERSGLKGLVEAKGDPVEILKRVFLLLSLYPQSLQGKGEERELFIKLSSVLLGGR